MAIPMTKIKKTPKPKKADLIHDLQDRLTGECWSLIHRLIGREIKPTSRANFLSGLFHKSSNRHSTSRDAAQDLQKIACELYSILTGVKPGSSRDDHAEIKPRQSGQAGVDVVLSWRIKENMIGMGFPDCCECKNVKEWNLQQAVRQARANTPAGSSWLLVMKRRGQLKKDRIDPIIIMDLGVFKGFLEYCMKTMMNRWPESWREETK